ncbi:MAG: MFS transporter [Chloroflexi bacterium]|nr:MFS transporter [Chloroflexota bacterium]MCI0800634.1 MFS transporter [Chloroflexota bacterium]MCI0811267.1 MFS transporter [Chloroflexota bacterium]MCI0829150.1 MFS transporter [Chloroflexota bacterium]MCI0847939.1 MFS transporter [Chloroflexota bacterium]
MRRPHYSWVILATGFFILFFSGGSRFAFGLMLKPMSEDLDVSRSTLSLAVTTFMVVSALALPFLGRLVDLWSLKGMIGIAAVVAGVGIGLMGQVDAPWQVFIVYGVVYALGNAGTSTSPVTVMISRWFPNRRGIAGSGAVAGNAVGQLVIVMALAAVLVSLDWRWSFTILGIANLAVLAPLVFLAVRDKPREADLPPHGLTARAVTPPESALSLGRTLTSPRLALLMAIYAICGFQDFFVSIHIVAFALDQGVGTVMAGNLLALMGLMGLMGVLASGLLADRFGAVRPTVTCFWVRIFIFALIIFDQSTLSIMVFGLLYGFTFLITAPLTVVFVGNIFGAARLGTLAGSISMVHQIAGGFGAYAGAWIFDNRGSYDDMFRLMLILSVAAAVLTLLVRERPLAGAATSSPPG